MNSLAKTQGSHKAVKITAASIVLGALFFFWSLMTLAVTFGLSFLVIAATAVLTTRASQARSLQQQAKHRQRVLEDGRQRENLERARTWQFELAEMPFPDPTKFVLGKHLIKHALTRRHLLLDAVNRPPEVKVTLRFRLYGIEMRDPVQHTVGSRHLYESTLKAKTPCVSFPSASVDRNGRISDYGNEAVLFGCKLGLPKWKDELDRSNEEPWLWQVPR